MTRWTPSPHLIELHLRFHGYSDAEVGKGAAWTDSAVRRYVRDAGDDLERLHILTRSDSTTRNRRRAERLRRAYDELEWRIDELSAQEQLDALRPALDGQQIMAVLGISEGPAVGRAYKFLLAQRIDRGPMSPEEAEALLLDWWEREGRTAAESPRRAGRRHRRRPYDGRMSQQSTARPVARTLAALLVVLGTVLAMGWRFGRAPRRPTRR